MIEFGTALAAALAALGWALWTGRPLLRRGSVGRSQHARFGPLGAGVQSLLRPSSRALAAIAGLLAFLGFVAFGVVRTRTPVDPTASTLAFGAWLAAAFLLGALASAAVAQLATWAALRLAAAPAARAPAPGSVALLVAATSLGSLVPSFAALIVLLAMCVGALAATGGFSATGAATAVPAWSMAQLVVAFGAGTALGALFSRLAGGWFDASLASTRGSPDSAPSASARAALAGVIGFGSMYAVDLISTWSVVAVTALLPGASLASTHAAYVHSAISVTLFPILVLTFALLSSALSTMVIRSEDDEPALTALLRGLSVCVVLCAGSLLGVAHWVFDTLWSGPFLAGLGGLSCAVAALLVGGSLGVSGLDRPSSRAWMGSRLVGGGFDRAAALLTVALLCFFGGSQLMGLGLMGQAGSFGAAAAVVGFLAPAPFVLVGSGFGFLGKLSPAMTGERSVREAERPQGKRLAGARILGACRAYAATAALLAGMLALQGYSFVGASYSAIQHPAPGGSTAPSIVVAAAVTGLALVFSIAGHLFRTAARVARNTAESEPAEPSGTTSSVAETTRLARAAVRQGITSMLVILGISAGGWLLVKAIAARGGEHATIDSTSAWLVLVVATGGALSAALGGGRPEPSPALKSAVDGPPDSANNRVHGAAVVNDQLGIPFGYVAGPALHALARLLPAVVVALAPLVH